MFTQRFLFAFVTAAAAAVVMIAKPAQAALDGFSVNSSTFTTQYDGNQIWDGATFLNDWDAAGGATAANVSLNGSDLTLANTANNGWLHQDSGSSPWESGSGSWTLEISAKLNDTTAANDNFNIWSANGGRRTNLTVTSTGVAAGISTVDDLLTDVDNTDAFHTYRIAYDATEDQSFVWRDDVQLTSALGSAADATDRLILGDCCTSLGNPVDPFELRYVRYDFTGAYSPIADQGTVALTIDRDTGAVGVSNTTGTSVENIIGYSLLSDAGSLNGGSANLFSSGSPLSSDNDTWTTLSTTSEEIAEAVLNTPGDGDGGNLNASASVSIGNVWKKTPFEDLELQVLFDDGSILSTAGGDFATQYTGDSIAVGDLAGATVNDEPDGDIDLVDWVKFRASVGTDVSALSQADAYLSGDLTGDSLVNASDFNRFVSAFDAANGAGSFAQAIGGVPEPATTMLLLVGLTGVAGCRTRRRSRTSNTIDSTDNKSAGINMKRLSTVLAAPLLVCLAAVPASAVSDFVVANYDADAGNPANAAAIQSPLDQGFTEWGATQQAQTHDPALIIQEGVVNGGVNAYRNFDNGPTNPGWVTSISLEAEQAMFDYGWRYELTGLLASGGHFSAFGVSGANNPWGLPANARVGIAYGTDEANWTANPVGTGGASVTVGPQGSAFAQAVLTGDPGAITSTFEVFNFDSNGVGSQIGATQNLTGWSTGVLSNSVLGVQAGSSPGTGLDAQHNAIRLTIPAPDTLTVEVNKDSGAVTLINNSTSTVEFNGYFLESEGGQLSDTGWSSLESIDLDGNGVPNDGIGWEEFDASDANFLGEGYLTGASSLGPGGSLSLGNAYNPAIAGVGNDGDLSFTLTDASGRSVPSSLFSTVEYVSGGGIDGDFDNDGDVDIVDFGTFGQNFGLTGLPLDPPTPGDFEPDGDVDIVDFGTFGQNFGIGTGSGSAIPEPGTALLAMMGTLVVGLFSRRRMTTPGGLSMESSKPMALPTILTAAACVLATAGIATADVTNDRSYSFGDDSSENGTPGGLLGVDFGGTRLTFDSEVSDTSSPLSDAQDLTVTGGATYIAVDGTDGGGLPARPGAAGGTVGANLDGVDDSLSTIPFNSPDEYWDAADTAAWVDPPEAYPRNYDGIFSRGIEFWVYPDSANNDGEQHDIIRDTNEHGVVVTANGTWGNAFDNAIRDSGVAVAFDQWSHVQVVTRNGAAGSILYVDGIAVEASTPFYDPQRGLPLVIGSNFAGDGEFFTGVIDDMNIFLWGDNEEGTPGTLTDGEDWGTFNLGEDNVIVAQNLANAGVTDAGDVNLDGSITAADATAFVGFYGFEQLVTGVSAGDWVSRQNGDLNYDGLTNLADAFILHEALQTAGIPISLGSLIGASVPEPSSLVLVLLATAGWAARRRS